MARTFEFVLHLVRCDTVTVLLNQINIISLNRSCLYTLVNGGIKFCVNNSNLRREIEDVLAAI